MATNHYEMTWEALRDLHAVNGTERDNYVGSMRLIGTRSNGVEIRFKKGSKSFVARYVGKTMLDLVEYDGFRMGETLYYHGQDSDPMLDTYEQLAKQLN